MASNDFELREKHKKSPWGRQFSNEFNSCTASENGYSCNSDSSSELKSRSLQILNPLYLNTCVLVPCRHKNCGKLVKVQSFKTHITDYHNLSIAEYAKEINVNSRVACDPPLKTNNINSKSNSNCAQSIYHRSIAEKENNVSSGYLDYGHPLETNYINSESNVGCAQSNTNQLDSYRFDLGNDPLRGDSVLCEEKPETDIYYKNYEKDSLSSFNQIEQPVPIPLGNNRKRPLRTREKLSPSTMKMKKPTLDSGQQHASNQSGVQECTAASQPIHESSVDSVYSSLNLESLSNLTLQEINEKDKNSEFRKHMSDLVEERKLFASSSSPSDASNKLPHAFCSLTSSSVSVQSTSVDSFNQLSSHLSYSKRGYLYPDKNVLRLFGHHQGMSPLHVSSSDAMDETYYINSRQMQRDSASPTSAPSHVMEDAKQPLAQRVKTQRMMDLHSKGMSNSHENINEIPEQGYFSSSADSESDEDDFLGSATPNSCFSPEQHTESSSSNDCEDLSDDEEGREPCLVHKNEAMSCVTEREEIENASKKDEEEDDSGDDWWDTPANSSNHSTMMKPKVPLKLATKIGSESNSNMRKEVGVRSSKCTSSVSEETTENSTPDFAACTSPVRYPVKTNNDQSNCFKNCFKFHAFYPLTLDSEMLQKAEARDRQLRNVWLPDPNKEPFKSSEFSVPGLSTMCKESSLEIDDFDKCNPVMERSGTETYPPVVKNTSENGATKLNFTQDHSTNDERMHWNDVPDRESEKRPFSEVDPESPSSHCSSDDNSLNRKRPRSVDRAPNEDSENEWLPRHRNNSIPNGS